MILTEQEVLAIVKDKPSPAVLAGTKGQNDHKVHIQGTGFNDVLKRIIGYENVEQFKQKKLLTQPFTRPIFKKIMDAQSRWKTARGTKRLYKFKDNNEKLQKEFRDDIMSEVWHRTSIETFVKNFLADALYQEFNGFTLVEIGRVEEIDGKRFEFRGKIRREITDPLAKLKPFFAFIAIEDVHNYLVQGETVEWLAYDFGKIKVNKFFTSGLTKVELFRVIDDKFDYIVEKSGDKVRISEKFPPMEHNATACPVSNITFMNEKLTEPRVKTSPVDIIIKLMDYYLHQYAEHLVTEVLHAHPIYYQVGQKCTWVIEGVPCANGRILGQTTGSVKAELDHECPNCKGTGHNMHKDASTVLIVPAKDADGNPFNLTNIAGYVSPPTDILKYQQDAIDWMENKILDAALGLNNFTTTNGLENTATGVIANIKPLEDIISSIIDVVQVVEQKLTDFAGKMFYGDDVYIGSEIIYGRKISLRDENVILTEITQSKAAGVSVGHIKTLMEELTHSRFLHSEKDLARNLVLMQIEPLVGFTEAEVLANPHISREVKILKSNFNDFVQRFELENGDIVDFEKNAEFDKKVLAIKKAINAFVIEITGSGNQDPPPDE